MPDTQVFVLTQVADGYVTKAEDIAKASAEAQQKADEPAETPED